MFSLSCGSVYLRCKGCQVIIVQCYGYSEYFSQSPGQLLGTNDRSPPCWLTPFYWIKHHFLAMLCHPSLPTILLSQSVISSHFFERGDTYTQKGENLDLVGIAEVQRPIRENRFFCSQHSSKSLPSIHQLYGKCIVAKL